jgi:hypothetical protein
MLTTVWKGNKVSRLALLGQTTNQGRQTTSVICTNRRSSSHQLQCQTTSNTPHLKMLQQQQQQGRQGV